MKNYAHLLTENQNYDYVRNTNSLNMHKRYNEWYLEEEKALVLEGTGAVFVTFPGLPRAFDTQEELLAYMGTLEYDDQFQSLYNHHIISMSVRFVAGVPLAYTRMNFDVRQARPALMILGMKNLKREDTVSLLYVEPKDLESVPVPVTEVWTGDMFVDEAMRPIIASYKEMKEVIEGLDPNRQLCFPLDSIGIGSHLCEGKRDYVSGEANQIFIDIASAVGVSVEQEQGHQTIDRSLPTSIVIFNNIVDRNRALVNYAMETRQVVVLDRAKGYEGYSELEEIRENIRVSPGLSIAMMTKGYQQQKHHGWINWFRGQPVHVEETLAIRSMKGPSHLGCRVKVHSSRAKIREEARDMGYLYSPEYVEAVIVSSIRDTNATRFFDIRRGYWFTTAHDKDSMIAIRGNKDNMLAHYVINGRPYGIIAHVRDKIPMGGDMKEKMTRREQFGGSGQCQHNEQKIPRIPSVWYGDDEAWYPVGAFDFLEENEEDVPDVDIENPNVYVLGDNHSIELETYGYEDVDEYHNQLINDYLDKVAEGVLFSDSLEGIEEMDDGEWEPIANGYFLLKYRRCEMANDFTEFNKELFAFVMQHSGTLHPGVILSCMTTILQSSHSLEMLRQINAVNWDELGMEAQMIRVWKLWMTGTSQDHDEAIQAYNGPVCFFLDFDTANYIPFSLF